MSLHFFLFEGVPCSVRGPIPVSLSFSLTVRSSMEVESNEGEVCVCLGWTPKWCCVRKKKKRDAKIEPAKECEGRGVGSPPPSRDL